MELREWLIILGLALVSLIVIDGVRRLQRQRRVPRLDQAEKDKLTVKPSELDDKAREAEVNWELPNGGARVVKPADYSALGKKPKLERQEHPGASKVLSEFRRSVSSRWSRSEQSAPASAKSTPSAKPAAATAAGSTRKTPGRVEPGLTADSLTSKPVTSTPESKASEFKSSEAKPSDAKSSEPKSSESSLERSEMSAAADAKATAPEAVQQPTEQASVEPAQDAVAQHQDNSAEETATSETQASSAIKESSAKAEVAEEKREPTLSSAVGEPSVSASATVEETAPTLAATEKASAEKAEDDGLAVLRAEPEDAVFVTGDAPKRRKLRDATVGEYSDDEYRLVDFEGIGRSFKQRMADRREERKRKKEEKAERAAVLAKQKAERKALEAEQRREAKEAAAAERARIAQEQAEAREAAAAEATAERLSASRSSTRGAPDLGYIDDELPARGYAESASYYDDGIEAPRYAQSGAQNGYGASDDVAAGYSDDATDAYGDDYADAGIDEAPAYAAEPPRTNVSTHPTLAKALRHDVCGEHAKEVLSSADEVIVISVLARDEEGFDGSKLLELIMACGLRYSSAMGIFHRFETESAESELQFSMLNVVKPGTFPIEEMGEFTTPGITFLMPLPGAIDSSAAFEAMVETAMVVVRHMGGELKDEHRSVMTAQTIEFARQRVHEFERRNRLQRHMHAH